MHAKSAGEFRLALDSAIAQSEVWSRLIAERSLRPNENSDFTFLLTFGLSPNLGLGDDILSERLLNRLRYRDDFFTGTDAQTGLKMAAFRCTVAMI